MTRLIAIVGTVGLALIGCQKDSSSSDEKLDQIVKRLDSIEQKLGNARVGAARPGQPNRRRPPRPDPKKVYSVPVDGAPFSGPENAKVTIVKAFEYACPYCDKVRPTIDGLKKKYGDDLKVVYKNLLVHPQVATTPALAACAAHKQGKYHEMSDLIWEKGFRAGRNLGQENMEKLAGELGLNMEKFKSDMQGECKAVVRRDEAELRRVGAGGTPAFFINGRFLSGARPQPMFEAVIDEELKKANDAISKGTNLSSYYAENVVKKGLNKLEVPK